MTELIYESATRLARLIRERQVSPVEVVEAHIRRIEEVNPVLNAFVTTVFDRARDEARVAEARVTIGGTLGPLHGVPVSIKDTIETAGIRTVAGTKLRESFVPDSDANVVTRLRNAGAIVLGKTNVPECAMDYRSENPVFGRTSNPWDETRVPGGSSGGEAAAISSGCSALGVGSDLGGSIRIPSHFCGIVGLKPTPGRVPATGHFPPSIGPFAIGASLGPMARRVEDLALCLEILCGFDPDDPVSVPLPTIDRTPRDVNRLRVLWYGDDGVIPTTPETKEAVERAAHALADRGLDVEERRPEGIERGFDLWYSLFGQGGVPGLLAMYEGKEELMGPLMRGLKRRSESETASLADFLSAWLSRDGLRRSVLGEMKSHPILLAPVTAMPAFTHDHKGAFKIDGHDVAYLKAFSYSMLFNVLGLPSAVVPCGRSKDGLPIGVQVAGRPYEEETVLAVASVLEEALGGYQRPPI
jgi:Asp-tRNA(Asn)/Glu-tRNA(Gln) amidotransferase A subunit family amidase